MPILRCNLKIFAYITTRIISMYLHFKKIRTEYIVTKKKTQVEETTFLSRCAGICITDWYKIDDID